MDQLVKNSQIQFVLFLKLKQLQRNELSSLTMKHLEDTLDGFVWKFKQPKTLNEAVNDILALQINEIIGFLSQQAIIDGASMELSDLGEWIGGNLA